jgi:hypothetical protein
MSTRRQTKAPEAQDAVTTTTSMLPMEIQVGDWFTDQDSSGRL